MNEEKMYIPSGLKTRDGKDIMCYTGEFYLKNKEKIDKLVKKCEEILKADFENDNPSKSQENATNILKEDSETYNLNTHLNKKHYKLFKEILSDKKEAVKFINHYLNLCLVESDIEKYEKEFRTNGFYNIEADIVYKLKEKNVFILIEHQSSVDLKMAYRILCYKNAIIESAIDKKRLKERNYKIPKVIAIVLYTGKRKWNSLSINDIEEKIDGYENPNNEYHLIDSNEFSRNKLLSDNLITSKAMLIEKSKNKDELYKITQNAYKEVKSEYSIDNGARQVIDDINDIVNTKEFLGMFDKNHYMTIVYTSNIESFNKKLYDETIQSNIGGMIYSYFTNQAGDNIIASYDTFNKGFRWNESDKNYIMTLTKVIASVL